MPRDLADVLHYFLPELDEAPPSAVTSGPPDRIHGVYGELGATPPNVVLGALAGFVAWGRMVKAPLG